MSTIDSPVFSTVHPLKFHKDRNLLQGRTTIAHAWKLPHADLLLRLAEVLGVDRRLLVRAWCACARMRLVHVPAGEDAPRVVIETAEAWARGEATADDVRRDAAPAFNLAGTDPTCAAYEIAYVATRSLQPEGLDTGLDIAISIMCDSFPDRAKALAEMADIVRSVITLDDLAAALEAKP